MLLIFSEKFGLYHVDFSSPDRTRTAKLSAKVYGNIAKTRIIDWHYRPKPKHTQMARFDYQMVDSAAASRMTASSWSQLLVSCAACAAVAMRFVR